LAPASPIPRAAPTSASGLTLAPSSVKAVPVASVLPAAREKKPAAAVLLWPLFGLAALALAVYSGTFLHGAAGTPTPVGAATPVSTGGITIITPDSVATPAPTRTRANPQPTRVASTGH